MGYRKHRDTRTRPRRIHATNEEWAEVVARAGASGQSISACMVSRTLRHAKAAKAVARYKVLQGLTASHALLAEIADAVAENLDDASVPPILMALSEVSEKLDAALRIGGVTCEQEDVDRCS